MEDIKRNGHPKMYRSSENTEVIRTLFCSEKANSHLSLLCRSTDEIVCSCSLGKVRPLAVQLVLL